MILLADLAIGLLIMTVAAGVGYCIVKAIKLSMEKKD